MSWHNPDLYFFLGLLTGLAAFLAIIYECIQRFRRQKPPPKKYLKKARPLDGLPRERRARHDLPDPNPIGPGLGAEERLRELQRRFRAVSEQWSRKR
jgi:hypothetical protein